jgi:hypothetical protein
VRCTLRGGIRRIKTRWHFCNETWALQRPHTQRAHIEEDGATARRKLGLEGIVSKLLRTPCRLRNAPSMTICCQGWATEEIKNADGPQRSKHITDGGDAARL